MTNEKTCVELCCKHEVSCPNEDCRQWINFEEDLNCTTIAIQKHGDMTLREAADRLGISYVRVKQIEDEALKKISKRISPDFH